MLIKAFFFLWFSSFPLRSWVYEWETHCLDNCATLHNATLQRFIILDVYLPRRRHYFPQPKLWAILWWFWHYNYPLKSDGELSDTDALVPTECTELYGVNTREAAIWTVELKWGEKLQCQHKDRRLSDQQQTPPTTYWVKLIGLINHIICKLDLSHSTQIWEPRLAELKLSQSLITSLVLGNCKLHVLRLKRCLSGALASLFLGHEYHVCKN